MAQPDILIAKVSDLTQFDNPKPSAKCEVCGWTPYYRLLRPRLITGLRNIRWSCHEHVEVIAVTMAVEGTEP